MNPQDAFISISKEYDAAEPKTALKIKHTGRVAANMEAICTDQHVSEDMRKKAMAAAWFHDLGRFEQIKYWSTFNDAKSADHAALSVDMIERDHLLDDFSEKDRKQIKTAIAVHNRLAIPEGLDEETEWLAKALRDADKVDIMRVFATDDAAVEQPDAAVIETETLSPKVLEAMEEGRSVLRADRQSGLDQWISFLGMINDLNFPVSARRMLEQGYWDQRFRTLKFEDETTQKQVDSIVEKARKHLEKLAHRDNVLLIASDLDGTLLNGKKELLPKTREAIKKLKNAGIYFGIATGRPVESTILLADEVWDIKNDLSFIIGANGQSIYDMRTKELDEFYLIPGEKLLKAIHHFKDMPDLHFEVMKGRTRYVEYSTPATLENAHLFREKEIITDLDKFLPARFFNKLIIRSKQEDQPAVIERGKSFHEDGLYGLTTSEVLYEINEEHINKGFGLDRMADHYGISTDHAMAFGDEENDLQMLEMAGMGVAMKNALQADKDVATDINPYSNEEDGVGLYIEEQVLPYAKGALD